MAIVTGWGRGTWGEGSWGTNIPVTLTGQTLSTSLNSVTIKADSTAILISDNSLRLVTTLESVTVIANSTTALTSLQLNLNLDSVSVIGTGNTLLTGEQLISSINSVNITGTGNVLLISETLQTQLGELDVGPDASVSGEQVPVYLGDVNVLITFDAFVPVTGEQLTTTLNSVSITTEIDVS